MNEQDYYAQFVGDDNYDLDRWPVVTQDTLDRLNELTYERVKVQSVLFGVSVTERDNCGVLYCMEEHDWIKKSDGSYYCPICRMDRP